MHKVERVIVLKTTKYSESDLIVRTLSSEGEIISFIAKGAQKSKKRFVGGVLEPTRFIKVSYRDKNKDSGEERLHFLNEAVMLESFDGIRKDYDRLEMSFCFLKTILKMSQQGLADSKNIFMLLGQALRSLESEGDIHKLKTSFETHLLQEQGVCPVDIDPSFFQYSLANYGQLNWSLESWRRQSIIVESALRNYLN